MAIASGASQLCDPLPKSLSLREMDFEIRLSFSLGEKGLGDEGAKFAKVGCTHSILKQPQRI